MSSSRSPLLGALLVLTIPFLAAADPGELERDRHLREAGWAIDNLEITGADRPGVRLLTVTGRIGVGASSVWHAIAYENETEWPGVDGEEVEYLNGDTTIARYKISVPIFKDRRYRIRIVNDDKTMREDFQQVPGYGNVRAIDGWWQVQPVSDSVTRVDYVLYTDPGVRLIPGFIINWATKRMVPDLYEHIFRDASNNAAKMGSMRR